MYTFLEPLVVSLLSLTRRPFNCWRVDCHSLSADVGLIIIINNSSKQQQQRRRRQAAWRGGLRLEDCPCCDHCQAGKIVRGLITAGACCLLFLCHSQLTWDLLCHLLRR
ncbi:hypothetical protein ElyMa_000074600 [Elysia marginata]|uniref:Uncharacterized protein n=1 Tax=Elysia marginata TaxID=1093978 RepID=A0AAV4EHK5_9GAST|nr:hypothetical protein ElyMa_000074600 [Elysia marginata]